MLKHLLLPTAVLLISIGSAASGRSPDRERANQSDVIRVGIIGLDTSHATAFTKTLNNPSAPTQLSGCRVVVACPDNPLKWRPCWREPNEWQLNVSKLCVKHQQNSLPTI